MNVRLPDAFIVTSDAFRAIPGVQKLQEQIESHLEIVRSLKTEQNMYSRINQLPPELFARILNMAKPRHSDHAGYSTTRDAYIVRKLIALTQVCSIWRKIALSTPSLWDIIPMSRPKWGHEMLERSKGAPISVIVGPQDIYSGDQVNWVFLKFVVAQMNRIANLDLALLIINATEFRDLLALKAPFLHTLRIKAIGPGPNASSFQLPKPLFSGETPRLRHVRLENCVGIDYLGPSFRCLSSLFLEDVPDSDRLSVSQVLTMLGGIPDLERLSLVETISEPNTVDPFQEAVTLRKLFYLRLNSSVLGVSTLLKKLDIPTTAKLNLAARTTSFSQASESLAVLELVQASMMRGGEGPLPPGLTISGHTPRQLLLSWWTQHSTEDSLPYDPSPEHNDPCVAMLALIGEAAHNQVNALTQVLKRINIATLQTLAIATSILIEHTGTWLEILSPATQLEVLHVSGSSALALFRIIAKPRDVGSKQASRKPGYKHRHSGILLPKLHTLIIRELDWDEMASNRTTRELLTEKLVKRANSGAKLQCLDIADCHGIYGGDIASLECVVAKVNWDGSSNKEDDEDEFDRRYHDEWVSENMFDSEDGGYF